MPGKILRKIAAALCIVAAMASTSLAAKTADTASPARQYVAALPIEATVRGAFAAMLKGDPDAKALVKVLDIKAINTALEKAINKEFTPGEINSLVDSTGKAAKPLDSKIAVRVNNVLASTLEKELMDAANKYFESKEPAKAKK